MPLSLDGRIAWSLNTSEVRGNQEIFRLFEENSADIDEIKSFVHWLIDSYKRDDLDKRVIVKKIIDLLVTIEVSDSTSDFIFATYLELEELGVDKKAIFEQRYTSINY